MLQSAANEIHSTHTPSHHRRFHSSRSATQQRRRISKPNRRRSPLPLRTNRRLHFPAPRRQPTGRLHRRPRHHRLRHARSRPRNHPPGNHFRLPARSRNRAPRRHPSPHLQSRRRAALRRPSHLGHRRRLAQGGCPILGFSGWVFHSHHRFKSRQNPSRLSRRRHRRLRRDDAARPHLWQNTRP